MNCPHCNEVVTDETQWAHLLHCTPREVRMFLILQVIMARGR